MAKIHPVPFRCPYLLPGLIASLLLISCGKKVDPAPKPAQPPPTFEYLGTWGEKGQGPGKLDQPVAFATDALSRVLFVDPSAGFVHKFESKGTPLLSFEDPRLHHAAGIAVDSGGAIYVLDAVRGSILIFFPDGTFLQAWRSAPQPHFSGPLGIAIDPQGNVYVPDPSGSRVEKLDNRGRFAKVWAVPKDKSPDERPSSVAPTPDGSIFVAFFKTGRIEKYFSDTSFSTSWMATDLRAGESSPISGFTAGNGYVFTMASSPLQIRVWTLDGQHKLDGNLGVNLPPMAAPQIAVTPQSDLLVFDPSTPRVYWFRMHLDAKEHNDAAAKGK